MTAAGLLGGDSAGAAGGASSIHPGAAARDARLEPRLVAAAHAFEASLMQELLKPLHGGGAFGADEDGDGGQESGGGPAPLAEGSGGALAGFASEALAGALSEKGGLGIARRILDHFEAAAEAGEPAKLKKAAAANGRPGMKTDVREFQDGTTSRY